MSNFVNKLLMKPLLSLVLVLNFFVVIVYAQNNTDAQAILDKAAAKVQSSKGISVSFSLTQKDKFGHELSSAKGILKIKGSKYYIKQDANEIFSNGQQVWNYDGQKEVTVAKAGDDDELSPEQIITGFDKKDFDIKLLSSSINYQVQLTPVDKRKNFKQVILFLNKSTNLITKAVITDKTGSIIEINFSNISLNNTFPDSQFIFDATKHPGVEVVNQ
jgi:outer membrane lipoprotein carrier protein